jgi:hypothetical protein
MQIREAPRRSAPAAGALRSPMSAMMLAMFATMASFYVAGLWVVRLSASLLVAFCLFVEMLACCGGILDPGIILAQQMFSLTIIFCFRRVGFDSAIGALGESGMKVGFRLMTWVLISFSFLEFNLVWLVQLSCSISHT